MEPTTRTNPERSQSHIPERRPRPLLTACIALMLATQMGANCRGGRDDDRDGRPNTADNCLDVSNPNQVDSDSDGVGDACDVDAILHVLLVRVHTPSQRIEATDAELRAMGERVAAYFAEVSFGNLRLRGVDDPDAALDIADVELDVDWNPNHEDPAADLVYAALLELPDPGRYDEILFVTPTAADYPWQGVAFGPWDTGEPSTVWIRGTRALDSNLVAHEMGHNRGRGYDLIRHAGFLTCPVPPPYDPDYDGCSFIEYGDPFDAMGNFGLGNHAGHMNARFKEIAGFFGRDNVQEVTQDGSYWVAPLERASAGVQALKIRVEGWDRFRQFNWLYLEYRQPIGLDAPVLDFLASSADGVQIRVAYYSTETSGEHTALVMPNGFLSLRPGQTYDAGAFTATTLGSNASGTLVEIDFRD